MLEKIRRRIARRRRFGWLLAFALVLPIAQPAFATTFHLQAFLTGGGATGMTLIDYDDVTKEIWLDTSVLVLLGVSGAPTTLMPQRLHLGSPTKKMEFVTEIGSPEDWMDLASFASGLNGIGTSFHGSPCADANDIVACLQMFEDLVSAPPELGGLTDLYLSLLTKDLREVRGQLVLTGTTTSVPEPGTWFLSSMGLFGLWLTGRRFREAD